MLRDVVVVGGGPGGLFLSILLKRDWPEARVRVLERNRRDETYGFGVAFHHLTLRKVADADGLTRSAVDEILMPWDDVAYHVRGREYRVSGHGFAGCSRHRLIELLQRRAACLGVEIEYGRPASAEEFPDADLVVAADGAFSRARDEHPEHFRPETIERPNRFVWLGTTRSLDAINFFFAESRHGVFVAHAYPHRPDQGTWIVETDDATFERAGLDKADERDTVEYLQDVFHRELDGHTLITNNSFWRRFPLITTERWSRANTVLLGDAKGTVHYSMGSGTKLAVEDAIELHAQLRRNRLVSPALDGYESTRKKALSELQERGFGSMLWFERTTLNWPLDSAQFIFAGVTRKSDETYGTVASRTPELVRDATRALDPGSVQARAGSMPVHLPLDLAAVRLSNRIVGNEPTSGAGLVTVPLPVNAAGWNALADEMDGCRPAVVAGVQSPDGAVHEGDIEQAVRAGVEILVLDFTKGLDETAVDIVAAARRSWPSESVLGVRVVAPHDSSMMPSPLAGLVAAGVGLVDTTGGTTTPLEQLLLSELVHQELGVCTATGCDSIDKANTALAAGRADLVILPPVEVLTAQHDNPDRSL